MRSYFGLFLVSLSAFAHEGGEMSVRIGPDQGILEHSETEGFRLSSEARKRFQIETMPAPLAATFEVPQRAIIRARTKVGLYRERAEFIRWVPIREAATRAGQTTVTGADFRSGDRIVVQGSGFVRMIDAAFADEPEAAAGAEAEGAHHHD